MTDLDFDVLTIGNAIVDVFSRVEESFLARHSVTKGMMRLVTEKESPNSSRTWVPPPRSPAVRAPIPLSVSPPSVARSPSSEK